MNDGWLPLKRLAACPVPEGLLREQLPRHNSQWLIPRVAGGWEKFPLMFRKQLLKVLGKVVVFDAVSHAKKLRLGVLPATGWAPKVFGGESSWNAGVEPL